MFKSIARNTGPLVMLAGLFGLFLYAAPEHAPRASVLAATGHQANDCDRATACRGAQVALGKTFDQGEASILDVGSNGSTLTKSMCILHDGVGEAAAAGDAMISQAYNGAVVEGFGNSAVAGNPAVASVANN